MFVLIAFSRNESSNEAILRYDDSYIPFISLFCLVLEVPHGSEARDH